MRSGGVSSHAGDGDRECPPGPLARSGLMLEGPLDLEGYVRRRIWIEEHLPAGAVRSAMVGIMMPDGRATWRWCFGSRGDLALYLLVWGHADADRTR